MRTAIWFPALSEAASHNLFARVHGWLRSQLCPVLAPEPTCPQREKEPLSEAALTLARYYCGVEYRESCIFPGNRDPSFRPDPSKENRFRHAAAPRRPRQWSQHLISRRLHGCPPCGLPPLAVSTDGS